MLKQWKGVDVSEGLHFKAIRKWQLVQLGRDGFGAEWLNIACNDKIHIGTIIVGALGT